MYDERDFSDITIIQKGRGKIDQYKMTLTPPAERVIKKNKISNIFLEKSEKSKKLRLLSLI